MPITIFAPLPDEPFGPGFTFTVQSDFIGPQPTGTFWQLELTAPPDEILLAVYTTPWTQNFMTTPMVDGTVSDVDIIRVTADSVTGQPGQVRVQLIQPGPTVVEDETVAFQWDREQGQAMELKEWIRTHPPATAPTLTEEEHNAVLQTNTGVIAMSGFNVAQLVGDLGAALASGPPLGIGSLSGPYDITGDGELPDLHAAFQDRLGVYWVATTIPAGLSHRHGQSEEYPSRLVQWRTVHVVGGSEMVTEVLDATTHGELWQFAKKLPERVEYSVLPGVVIRARWWQFP